ncbi:HNH endonuclease [Blastococcus sp. TBT05-19]|uniref:HNH endonuclease n=1 Tax=Blastococcus sp. TBT05-19 TaxID=2250581 RepID=UPI000DE8F665|nr:HNH endonuclease [Blastococcus sp. TBT05-19]RBY88104.1 HNH endonuclease [Blastococcus sp. TBT05-19]
MELKEQYVRAAAINWLSKVTLDGTKPVDRLTLSNDFRPGGERFPLVDRGRGIRRPQGWSAALSIMTGAPKNGTARPYDDSEGPDGLHRYKLRRDALGRAENEGLRSAMAQGTPLIWFFGLRSTVFQAIFPVYLIAEEPAHDQFVMALTAEQRTVRPGSPVEESLRRWLLSMTKRRLHQPVFTNQVMAAYEVRCAVCSLNHRELLDAAHIIPDSRPHGAAVVPNGLALCKIHHAAYDRNILGIRPDLTVQIHYRLLDEIDGPMLRHGLKGHHGQPLMQIPRRRSDRPDTDRLAERFAEFLSA